MNKQRTTGAGGFALLCASCLLAVSCSEKKPESTAAPVRPAAPVVVAVAEQRDIPVQIKAIGNVEPMSAAAIRAQVNGLVTQVFFKEGDEVKKGQLLFQIDPRPFEVALQTAQCLGQHFLRDAVDLALNL